MKKIKEWKVARRSKLDSFYRYGINVPLPPEFASPTEEKSGSHNRVVISKERHGGPRGIGVGRMNDGDGWYGGTCDPEMLQYGAPWGGGSSAYGPMPSTGALITVSHEDGNCCPEATNLDDKRTLTWTNFWKYRLGLVGSTERRDLLRSQNWRLLFTPQPFLRGPIIPTIWAGDRLVALPTDVPAGWPWPTFIGHTGKQLRSGSEKEPDPRRPRVRTFFGTRTYERSKMLTTVPSSKTQTLVANNTIPKCPHGLYKPSKSASTCIVCDGLDGRDAAGAKSTRELVDQWEAVLAQDGLSLAQLRRRSEAQSATDEFKENTPSDPEAEGDEDRTEEIDGVDFLTSLAQGGQTLNGYFAAMRRRMDGSETTGYQFTGIARRERENDAPEWIFDDRKLAKYERHLSANRAGRRNTVAASRAMWALYWYFRVGLTAGEIAARLRMKTANAEKLIARTVRDGVVFSLIEQLKDVYLEQGIPEYAANAWREAKGLKKLASSDEKIAKKSRTPSFQ